MFLRWPLEIGRQDRYPPPNQTHTRTHVPTNLSGRDTSILIKMATNKDVLTVREFLIVVQSADGKKRAYVDCDLKIDYKKETNTLTLIY